jgi:rhamnulokinase
MNVIGFDLGASSGRCVLGNYDGRTLILREIHRFANTPVRIFDNLNWNIMTLLEEIEKSISMCARLGTELVSMGIDTWGVDYCLFDKAGRLLGNPYHYLDRRSEGVLQKIEMLLAMYAKRYCMGAVHPQSTLCQLAAAAVQTPEILRIADKMLLMPNALEYMLTGNAHSERSIASTTSLYDPEKAEWITELIDALDIPVHLFGMLVKAGTPSGPLLPNIIAEFGGADLKVTTIAGHDTASAVSIIPGIGGNRLFVSCGTCSIIGVCVDTPVKDNMPVGGLQLEANGNGRLRYVKNIMGLFFLQQCYMQWKASDTSITFEILQTAASRSKPFRAFLNFEDPTLLSPGNMPSKIDSFFVRTQQPNAESKGDYCIAIFQTLAMYYRQYIADLETLTGVTFSVLYIIGGGVQNTLLCQFAANATGKSVVAFCPEATVMGNCITQLRSLGELHTDSEVEELIARSNHVTYYTPRDNDIWDAAYGSFLKIKSLNGGILE